ncbi:MAG: hypothetical protein LBD31_00340 [Treponema sp.]|jgi:hypothetical protein|nr:hypothetical protein [Treponema sp.]
MNRWFLLTLMLIAGFACAQEGEVPETPEAVSPDFSLPLETSGAFPRPVSPGPPRWVKDLRRGEIVAFGSLPITMFFTALFMDLYRCAVHDWDRRYAPWPAKAAGAVPMETGELRIMIGIAVSFSLIITVADYLVVRHRRNRAAETEF